MEFIITNPGGQPDYVDIDFDFRTTYQKDSSRPRELTLNIKTSTPIIQYAEVVAKEGQKVLFRGYVEKGTWEGDKKTLNCKGIENLLNYRYLANFNYCFPSYYLYEVFKDSSFYSTTSTTGAGLLFIMNSLCPPNTANQVIDSTNNIIQFYGMGFGGRFGYADFWIISKDGAIKLTRTIDNSDLLSNPGYYFLDKYDAYIRPPVEPNSASFYKYPQQHGLLATDVFDTKIRLGDYPASVTLQGGFNTRDTFVGLQESIDLVRAHKCDVSWRDGRDYTFMDIYEL